MDKWLDVHEILKKIGIKLKWLLNTWADNNKFFRLFKSHTVAFVGEWLSQLKSVKNKFIVGLCVTNSVIMTAPGQQRYQL